MTLPVRDDCVRCGRPLPANGVLAAVPLGRRIAFDPARGRVWRICTGCGTWNLLGPEATAAALPELEVRAPSASGGGALQVTGAGGALELLRLGPTAGNAEGPLALAEATRHWATRLRRAEWFLPLFMFAMAIVPWRLGIHDLDDAGRLLMTAPIMVPLLTLRRWRRGASVSWGPLYPTLGVMAVGTAIVGFEDGPWTLARIAAITAVFYWLALPGGWFTPKTTLPSGQKVHFVLDRIDDFVIERDRGDGIFRMTLPGEFVVDGDDALYFAGSAAGLRDAAQVQAAHELARTVGGGLSGLLAAVDAWAPVDGSSFTTRHVPAEYWTALWLHHESTTRKGVIRRSADADRQRQEATALADEAERLVRAAAPETERP